MGYWLIGVEVGMLQKWHSKVGKIPSVNERFARRVMRGMNTPLHRLCMQVGTKSRGDDLDDMILSSFQYSIMLNRGLPT